MITIILNIRDKIYSSLGLVLLMGIYETGFEIRVKKMIFFLIKQWNGMQLHLILLQLGYGWTFMTSPINANGVKLLFS